IQMSSGDLNALGNPARTMSLMPFNFSANTRAAQIRQRFTSTSWDLKSFGKAFLGPYTTGTDDARRLWEFTQYTDTSVPPNVWYQFPPNFPSAALASQPFRPDLAGLLQVVANPNRVSVVNMTPSATIP